MNTTANLHFDAGDDLRTMSLDHATRAGQQYRSMTVEVVGEYGGFTVFCNAKQAAVLAKEFSSFAAEFIELPAESQLEAQKHSLIQGGSGKALRLDPAGEGVSK